MSTTTPSWIVHCTLETFKDRPFLQGPRSPQEVRKNGYGFTDDHSLAWPFPSEKQAKNKARIVNDHMGWTAEGVNHMTVKPAEHMHTSKLQPATY